MGNISNAIYLLGNNGPCPVVLNYLATACSRGFRKKHAAASENFRIFAKETGFRHDWFSSNVPFWMEVIEKYGLREKPIKALEIGSFEGLSACFMMQQLPLAQLTCVDTWSGSDEHVGREEVHTLEQSFDRHVAPWHGRVSKKKMTSLQYLATLGQEERFDFIYIDGSHHADDIMVDALVAFRRLQVGGVMILDDYLWRYYPRSAENPARAINGFLRLIEGRFRYVMAYRQLVLLKTSERST
jgi:predicted O-methyltransferase YrrM